MTNAEVLVARQMLSGRGRCGNKRRSVKIKGGFKNSLVNCGATTRTNSNHSVYGDCGRRGQSLVVAKKDTAELGNCREAK